MAGIHISIISIGPSISIKITMTDPSKAERALFTQRRKEIYKALHPETRGMNRARGADVRDKLSATFTADTAAKIGVDERTIRRDASRGERITPDVLRVVAGTSLDTGASLDKIARLPVEQRT